MPTTINAKSDPTVGQLIKASDGTANLTFQTSGTNALSINNLQNPTCNSTGSIKVPSGTTAQRPASPINGMVRYNTSYSLLEGYIGSAWKAITGVYTITTDYLVVAGGAGSGSPGVRTGGGGAGGFLTGTVQLTPSSVYTITVGAAGAVGASGANSAISGTGITTVTSIGGGSGGTFNDVVGVAGGSGGGGGGGTSGAAGGSGTTGQGFTGGTGAGSTGGGGGGGGSSAVGSNASGSNGGNGGNGNASSITGTSVTYAGGGGGGGITDGSCGTGGG